MDGGIKMKIPCLVYSRVVGYFQPVQYWNKGKKSEFEDRTEYSVAKIKEDLYGHI
jgi:anaerobic ribonucleoside-triphosphate reductase